MDIYKYNILTGQISNLSYSSYWTMEDTEAKDECEALNNFIHESYYWPVRVFESVN